MYPANLENPMPVHIDPSNQSCTLDAEGIHERGPASAVRVVTDSAKRMSMAELNGRRVPITEAEADALTVAGAEDARHHLRATDGDSVI
jgi:hypothetical protein